MKPLLAITMGDPAGIGPEVAVKVLGMREVYEICRPLVIGNAYFISKALEMTGLRLKLHKTGEPGEAFFRFGTIDILEIESNHPEEILPGLVSAKAGDLAFRSVLKAIELALEGSVDGTVTCPVNKKALQAAGCLFSGHTEIYAHFTGTEKYAMLLAEDQLRVVHVSTHVSLRKACDLVRKERILQVIELLHEALLKLGMEKPRIGVAGLNPHAGEEGLFGDEENGEIIPAINEASSKGICVTGPFPPDSLFVRARGGEFDGCVAMYHDQGHIPVKLSGFEWDVNKGAMKSLRGVNVTLGLPIVRTSVDHGTAFEIAGKGIASPDSLFNAVTFAVQLSKKIKS